MSDVSLATMDVFVSCANPQQTNVPSRTTRSAAMRESIRAPATLGHSDDEGADEQSSSASKQSANDDSDGEEEESGEEDEGAGEDGEDEESQGEGDGEVDEEEHGEIDDESNHDVASRNSFGSRVNAAAVPPPAPHGSCLRQFVERERLAPRKKTDAQLRAERMEKEAMLMDLQRLRDAHSVPMSKEWSMDDDIDDISFELKRIMLQIDETNNVAVMRNAMQLAFTGIEMMSKRSGILDLDGWSSEICADMDKYDRSLGHMRRTLSKQVFAPRSGKGGASGAASAAADLFGAARQFASAAHRRQKTVYAEEDFDEQMPP